jgi:hypothetical protein
MDKQVKFATIEAGSRLICGERAGTLSFLCVKEGVGVVGLSVSSISSGAEPWQAVTHRGTFELGNAVEFEECFSGPSSSDHIPISSMISYFVVPYSVNVRAEFLQVDFPPPPIDPFNLQGQLYLASARERRPLGPLTSICATTYRLINGALIPLWGAIEIQCEGRRVLQNGDAGKAVTTESGMPVGILVGMKPGIAVVAPIAELFSMTKLKMLTVTDAAQHNSHYKEAENKLTTKTSMSREENSTIAEILSFSEFKNNRGRLLHTPISSRVLRNQYSVHKAVSK